MTVNVQKITFEVRVGGRLMPHVTDVTTSAGFDQVNASASWTATEKPSWADEGQAVTIWATNSGTASGQIFGGELQAETWSYTPGQISMEGRDVLARTRLAWGGAEYEYTEQDDAAIIRNLLEKMGIPSSMASIESSSWTLGIIEPIVLKEGTAPYSIIQAIDDLAGYKTYSLTTGVIVRRRVSGMAGSGGALTFSKGVTILSGARRQRGRDGIVNRSVVTGLSYEGLLIGGPGVAEYQAANPYIPDPPGFITEAIQSNLVEDDDKALEIATRIVTDKNRRPEQVEFTIPLDPRPQPGMTVIVNHADLEISGTPLFVLHVEHRISSSGATTAIRAIGGALGPPPTIPPVAQFAIQTVLEAEDTGSGVEARVLVTCDGSSSYDPDGSIVSYAWTISVTGGTASPSSGSAAIFTTLLSGSPTEITVTLTVTDNDSLTGALSLTQAIDTSALPVEDLYIAAGDMYASSDGEQTWRQVTPASGLATCLMPLAMAYQVWGTTTGHVYATWDVLATAPIDLGQPHGAVACTAVWIHEDDPTRLWAAFTDGDVWQAVVDQAAHTASWTRRGNVGAGPVVEIRESVGTLGELRATAGAGYYYSITSGASWTLVHTFDTAWRMAAGFDRNLASGLNSTPPIYSEVDTAPSVPGGVTHIRGLSFGYRTQELYAADDAAHLYLGAGPSFDLTASADTTDAITNHMIRSGNVDRVIYMAVGDGTGDNGAQKWLPDVAAPFFVKRTGSAAGRMVGFGALHTPIITVTGSVLMVDTGPLRVSPAGVWQLVDGAWVHHTGGGLPDQGYAGIVADPLNASRWIVWNDLGDAAYLTTDAGSSWTLITGLSATGGSVTVDDSAIYDIAFSKTTAGQWCAVGQNVDGFFGERIGSVWIGSGAATTTNFTWNASGPLTPKLADVLGGIVAGASGQWYATNRGNDTWRAAFYTIQPTDTAIGDLDLTYIDASTQHHASRAGAIDRLPSSSTIVAGSNHSASQTDSVFVNTGSVALLNLPQDTNAATIAAAGALVYVGRGETVTTGSEGLYQISDITGAASTAAISAFHEQQVYFVDSDRQTQQVVAVLAHAETGDYIRIWDGTAWGSPIALPGGAAMNNHFAPRIEAIGAPA